MATAQTTERLLNKLLRGELSAVEAYDTACNGIEAGRRGIPHACRDSHARRVHLLRDRIRQLGGKPVSTPGTWGMATSALTGGGKVLGERWVIAILEEGEDYGNQVYREAMAEDGVDGATVHWIRDRLYTDQLTTHRLMSDFEKTRV